MCIIDHSVSTKAQNIKSQVSGTEQYSILLYDPNYLSISRNDFHICVVILTTWTDPLPYKQSYTTMDTPDVSICKQVVHLCSSGPSSLPKARLLKFSCRFFCQYHVSQAHGWPPGWAERGRCLSPRCRTPASTCRRWSAPRPTPWWRTSTTPAPARPPAAPTGTSQSEASGGYMVHVHTTLSDNISDKHAYMHIYITLYLI